MLFIVTHDRSISRGEIVLNRCYSLLLVNS